MSKFGPKEKKAVDSATKLAMGKVKGLRQGRVQAYLKQLLSIDVCLMFDLTETMKPALEAAVNTLTEAVEWLNKHMLFRKFRVAFVGYRDIGEEFSIVDFSDLSTTMQFMKAQTASGGGGDSCEDVFGAFGQVLKLQWASNYKLVLHLADMPGHGHAFNGYQLIKKDLEKVMDSKGWDAYPEHGTTQQATTILSSLSKLDAWYIMGSVHTDCLDCYGDGTCQSVVIKHWFEQFKSYAKEQDRLFQIPANDLTAIAEFITHSIELVSHSVKKSVSVPDDSSLHSKATKQDRIDPAQPKPKSIKDITVSPIPHAICFKSLEEVPLSPTCTDLMDYLNDLYDQQLVQESKISFSQSPAEWNLHIQPFPFAAGEINQAHYGFVSGGTLTSPRPLQVIKVPKNKSGQSLHEALPHAKNYFRCQFICRFVMQLFNQTVQEKKAKMADFSNYQLSMCDVEIYITPKSKVYIVEDLLGDQFVKYNNNVGSVSPAKSIHNDVAQAFSHFSFEKSGQKIVVVDLQGVGLRLTDAAIHFDGIFPLDSTDLGREGQQQFRRTHKRNSICERLELARI